MASHRWRRFVGVACLVTACSGPSPAPAPTSSPTPSPAPTLARGIVPVSVVHVCGRGGLPCPARFVRALHRDLESHAGYPFATPDTVILPSNGCGGLLQAPFGTARVTDSTVRWHVDYVGAGPDCWGGVVGFIRFAHPVYDMRSRLALVGTYTVAGRHSHVRRSEFYPAPELAAWVHTGPGWQPQKCRFCPPGG